MTDEKYTFGTARVRLEEIAAEVRKKDTSLEKSLDLLEEGVRLANICTELVDHTDVSAPQVTDSSEPVSDAAGEDHVDEASAPVAVEPDRAADESTDEEDVDEDYDDEDEPSDAASVE